MKDLCDKCGEEPISSRFLGREICSKCYDKINNILNGLKK